jgi:nitric-oxide synthase
MNTPPSTNELKSEALFFIESCYRELGREHLIEDRILQIDQEIETTGTYTHRFDELEHGALMAWRNSTRCIGRLFWKTLKVLDARQVSSSEEIREALERHLAYATNEGNIRSVISVFPPGYDAWAIENAQLIRYAGYRQADGSLLGDRAQIAFTERCQEIGWMPPQPRTQFDVLPWVIRQPDGQTVMLEIPRHLIMEVELEHPLYDWWKDMGLKWHAVPVISNMILVIGGIHYPMAPFNGWYMGTEIGSRNLGDAHRYNVLPEIIERMGLMDKEANLLATDRALVELNTSVLYSFEKKGVKITNHHEASRQFIHFETTEKKHGRDLAADWSWIVPPMSSSATEVFHRNYHNTIVNPNFYYREETI